MTKLIIQIPCFNEEATLPTTIGDLPKVLPGVDDIEVLIVDDGSTDGTVKVARELGIAHIVSLHTNQGLARAFMAGIEGCLSAGADIIVNTDADNQYRGDDIFRLVEPILRGEAEIVVGARPIDVTEHFSPLKKRLQRLGSWAVRVASGTDIADAPSGFRAMSRDAAMQLNVFNDYTYTLETIIQAGRRGIAVQSVPVRTNGPTRPSRLIKSIPAYVRRSIATIFRIFMVYKPFRTFTLLGSFPFLIGVLLGLRWIALYFVEGPERTHVPSLILGAILILMGFILFVLGLIGDLQSVNRRLLEDLQVQMRRERFDKPDGSGR